MARRAAAGRRAAGCEPAAGGAGRCRRASPCPAGGGGGSIRAGPRVALAELRRLLGPRGDGLDHLPSNPLPARLEVTPATTMGADDLQALVETLDRLPGVTEVQAAFGWVEPLERLRRGLRLGGLALGARPRARGARRGRRSDPGRAAGGRRGGEHPAPRRRAGAPPGSAARAPGRGSGGARLAPRARRAAPRLRSPARPGPGAGSARSWGSIPSRSSRPPGWRP